MYYNTVKSGVTEARAKRKPAATSTATTTARSARAVTETIPARTVPTKTVPTKPTVLQEELWERVSRRLWAETWL